MVVSAPHILQNWWQNIYRIHGAEIRGYLGELFTVTFKFLYFDITPTLEEFSSLTALPIRGRLSTIHQLSREFERTRGAWEHMRPRVFVMTFLGVMVFPIRSNSVDINILPMVINIFSDPQRFSLVPMILAEVLRSMKACIRGHDLFGGWNMLLQIWDYYMGARNRIESHEDRLRNWTGVTTKREEWHTFLNNLTGDAIQWKFSWIRGLAFVRTRYFFFIKLIGLRGIQPYAPFRVMRQF
ncbi:hypothetical protein R3W88_024609 [Solanum pinnatisectum]|uniref:Aminotransferase-like plant mobile domain-containing protein n=1 Tax=Solanum pinnatisectum TaxID=50273 RepID=A0AAV9M0W9_9SOLN|nr:hypothetical protein R3W88_024609 [Solanum pinnatisectum]